MVDGGITLTFYANNTGGNTGQASVTIHKDDTPPAISIISPGTNDRFSSAPSFQIDFSEVNLQRTWYSISDSTGMTVNVTFTGLTGTFNETVWASLTPGDITIRFYIQDEAGTIDFAEILLVKESSGLFGFDKPWIYIIIGSIILAIAVISATGYSKARKSKRLLQAKEEELKKLLEQKEEITEGDITVSKEKHFCLVHKGPIEGYSFICPECGAYYCLNCVEAIKEIENLCWSCKSPLDKNKKIKSHAISPDDGIKPVDINKGKKAGKVSIGKKAPNGISRTPGTSPGGGGEENHAEETTEETNESQPREGSVGEGEGQ
ncbi:MAG: hypothetical protein ACTSUE_19210 [Promethearchaeota archaeon]